MLAKPALTGNAAEDLLYQDWLYAAVETQQGTFAGLYVTNASPQSFEVRESRAGRASIDFDYRIVAKRAGYEAERLANATTEMHNLTEHRDQIHARSAAQPSAETPR